MAASLSTTAISSISVRNLASFDGLRPVTLQSSSVGALRSGALTHRSFRGLSVKAATTAAPKYTSLKPLGVRVLVKVKVTEENSVGGILLPSYDHSKPQGGEVIAVGQGKKIGENKIAISVKEGSQVVYSKYSGTEVEYNGSNHLILKEGHIVGTLETDDVKDFKPLNDRVLIKVAAAEEKTAGDLLLTEATKDKPSIGSVIAVGPGTLDEEGNRKPLPVSEGNTVLYMYSKYVGGTDFEGADGSEYIVPRASDIMAVLS